jgi:cell division protein FtsL
MTEYLTVKRIDNSRLARPASPAGMRDFWERVAIGAIMAGCLLFYAWQHFECIQQRIQLERLEARRAQATELNQQLAIEVALLRSPMRVDTIARDQLGLTVPVPGQLAPTEMPSDGILAQARASASLPRP